MDDNFEQLDFRIIMESCMDLASAIEQKNRQDISYDFYGIVELGRIAHFLRSLMRKDTDKEIPMKLFNRLGTTFNIYQTMTVLPSEDVGFPSFTVHEDIITIHIDSYKKVISFFECKWEEFETKGILNDKQKDFIKVLYSTLAPKKLEDLQNLCKNSAVLREILKICKDLSLLNYHYSGYYYSPKLFKNIDEKTLDVLSQYDITTNQIIEEMEKIQHCEAYPIEHLDDRIKKATIEGAFKGVLLPVTVELSNTNKKDFIFLNPKNMDCGDLSYETAAYFRYNEIYPSEWKGKLFSPSLFLNKLIKSGIAGDATSIGRNYFPIEVKGVVRIIKGSTSEKYRMTLLKPEVLKEAKRLLENEFDSKLPRESLPPRWLAEPAKFRARIKDHEFLKKNLFDLKKVLRDMA